MDLVFSTDSLAPGKRYDAWRDEAGLPDGRAEDWPLFVEYYTDDKIFPDFSGHEVWRFDHCKTPQNPAQTKKKL